MPLIYSIVESAGHPNFSTLYSQLGMEEKRLSSMRKAMSLMKKQPPDYVVAEFIYGYSNNYAGVNISNLDVMLYSLQKYAPHCRVIVFCNKDERQYTDKLQSIFPLHGVLARPVSVDNMKALLM